MVVLPRGVVVFLDSGLNVAGEPSSFVSETLRTSYLTCRLNALSPVAGQVDPVAALSQFRGERLSAASDSINDTNAPRWLARDAFNRHQYRRPTRGRFPALCLTNRSAGYRAGSLT